MKNHHFLPQPSFTSRSPSRITDITAPWGSSGRLRRERSRWAWRTKGPRWSPILQGIFCDRAASPHPLFPEKNQGNVFHRCHTKSLENHELKNLFTSILTGKLKVLYIGFWTGNSWQFFLKPILCLIADDPSKNPIAPKMIAAKNMQSAGLFSWTNMVMIQDSPCRSRNFEFITMLIPAGKLTGNEWLCTSQNGINHLYIYTSTHK